MACVAWDLCLTFLDGNSIILFCDIQCRSIIQCVSRDCTHVFIMSIAFVPYLHNGSAFLEVFYMEEGSLFQKSSWQCILYGWF